MLRLVAPFLAVVCLGVAGLLVYAGSRTPEPPLPKPFATLSIDPATHNFGDLSRDAVVKTEFTLTNSYPWPVTIESVSKGCSCSEAKVEPETIPPGGTAQLSVTWTLRGKRGASSEAIGVLYSGQDGAQGFLATNVTANVATIVEPDRELIEISRAKPESEINFTSKIGRAFKITHAVTNHPSLTTKVDADGQRVQVLFDPTKPGWESGQLFLVGMTDQPDEPEVRVWIRVSQ